MSEDNVTVVIPVHNMMNKVTECFNSIYRQIYFGDQIIIINRASTDGLSKGVFPKDKRIIYLEDDRTETILINDVIRKYSENNCILVLDPIVMASNNMIKYLKENHNRKQVKIFRTDWMNDKKKVVDDKNAGSDPHPELCNMYSLSFDRREGYKVGLFNEYYDRDDTCSHGVLFCHAMTELNECELQFIEQPKVIKQLGRARKHLDKGLTDYLKKSIENGTYKYRNEKGKYTVIDESKLKNITVIIPSKQEERLIKEVKGQLTGNDELITFNSGIATVDTRIKDAIEKAKNDYVLLLNPKLEFYVPDYVVDVKLNCSDDKILIIVPDECDISEINNVDNISLLEEDLGMATNIKGIGGEDGIKVSMQSDTNRIIKRVSATPEKQRELLKRVEKNYSKGRKLKRRKKKKEVEANNRAQRKQRDDGNLPKYESLDQLPTIQIKNRKPKVLFICDVKGWAWWNKSHKLSEYLSDEFYIDVVSVVDDKKGRNFNTGRYDLYFTYGYSYVEYLNGVPFHKRISGVTAHRPLKMIKTKMRKVAITHANSMLLYNELQKVHPIVFYVPNGVDEKMFYPTEPIPEERDNIIVGHVGKLCAPKGQKQIIEPAIKRASAEYINNYSTYLKKKPQNKMIDIYNEMDVFICASLEDGTPNPALEAAACGRPIISNKIGNMPEFIEDGYNGFLVDRDIDAYVEKIKYLRDNRDKLIEMGENARKTVEEEWTWERQAERYRDMFKAILKLDM